MKGVLLFAFSNDQIDYFQQAIWCADRVVRHLSLPVTIVTNEDRDCDHDTVVVEAESGGTRVFNPSIDQAPAHWYNAVRYRSFELSPYDQTLVIDTDYVVASDRLKILFNSDRDLYVCRDVFDPTGRDNFRHYQDIAKNAIHHWWATVMYFEKNNSTRLFFDYYKMIRNNYSHYSDIYQFRRSPFRNDYAASIAINTMYGHVDHQLPALPWKMFNVNNDVDIRQLSDDSFELTYQNQNQKPSRIVLSDTDFHFMNKRALAKLYEN